ncbi:MAG: serine protease [Cyclobacteriaceae bacterium]
MGLTTEILRFFFIDIENNTEPTRPKTIGEFVQQPQYFETVNMIEVFQIINKLKTEGYITSAGHFNKIDSNPLTNEALLSLNFDEGVANYGSYDFITEGFRSIANYFKNAVRPVIIKKGDKSLDIGTSFLLGNQHTLVTARHVVEDAELIQIPDINNGFIQANKIIFPKNEKIDLAIILAANHAFKETPVFNVSNGEILENVLTIGYPPISGFDAMQLYEVSSINNAFKFSKGQIVGKDKSYFDDIEYTLINAKVKGGNSGSPVINKKGNVVGVVVQIPMDSDDSTQLDRLGYGVVTPKSEIMKLLVSPDSSPELIEYEVENLENGFRIKK